MCLAMTFGWIGTWLWVLTSIHKARCAWIVHRAWLPIGAISELPRAADSVQARGLGRPAPRLESICESSAIKYESPRAAPDLGIPARQYPSTAFALALAAGLLVILAGLVTAAVGAIFTFFLFGVGAILGLVGVLWGVLLIICAMRLKSTPNQHITLGVAIVVLSFLSFFGAAGGFALGFLLGLIGGMMAVAWSPPAPSDMSATAMPGATRIPVSAGSGSTKFCPSCGAPVEAGAKFCRNCDKSL